MDIFALPSEVEGQPVSIMEAMRNCGGGDADVRIPAGAGTGNHAGGPGEEQLSAPHGCRAPRCAQVGQGRERIVNPVHVMTRSMKRFMSICWTVGQNKIPS